MCVRAIDYCPPLDVTFGDFLRALVTADRDLVPNDDLQYLPLFVEAFRLRGIYPRYVRTLSVESLCWNRAGEALDFSALFREPAPGARPSRQPRGAREAVAENARAVQSWLTGGTFSSLSVAQLGLVLGDEGPAGLYRTVRGRPQVEVHSVRQAWRVGPDGRFLTELVVDVTQRRRGYYNIETQAQVDEGNRRERACRSPTSSSTGAAPC